MTITRTLGAVLLAASGLAAPTLLATPAHAAAAACTTSGITAGAASDGDKCTATGTLTLNGGSLTAKPPTTLAWGGTIGTDQQIVDTTAAHQSIEVDDLTGSGSGWHLTAAATTFTTAGGTHTLADASTLKVNGSTSDNTANAAPSAACAGTDACTVPVPNISSYPVTVATASTPTAVSIYSAKANSGLGKITLGSLGWWIHVPADAYSGTYTSTITLSVVSAP